MSRDTHIAVNDIVLGPTEIGKEWARRFDESIVYVVADVYKIRKGSEISEDTVGDCPDDCPETHPSSSFETAQDLLEVWLPSRRVRAVTLEKQDVEIQAPGEQPQSKAKSTAKKLLDTVTGRGGE